jgi:hypothetical protein
MPVASSIEDEVENRPQPAPSGREGKYQRPDVSQYDRLDIAHRYFNPKRPWGEVTKMAQEYALSRVTIYAIVLRVLLCFQPDMPGPKIGLAGQLTAVKEAVHFLRAEEAERLRGRIILTGIFPGGGTMGSLEDMLDEVPGVDGSAATIWRRVNQKGARANTILQQIDFGGVTLSVIFVAIDETFFDGRPILMVVEPISVAICGFYVPADGDRSSLSWGPFLLVLQEDQKLNFTGAMGDGATSYPGTIESILEQKEGFQEDIFHTKRDLRALARKLENKAYRAFAKEEEELEKWQKEATPEKKTAMEQAKLNSLSLAENYDNFVEYSRWAGDAFELVDLSSGEIREHAINEWLLETTVEAMLESKEADVVKMGRRLHKHKSKLLTYLKGLDTNLPPVREELHAYLDDPALEKVVLRSVARHWRLQHEVQSNQHRSFRPALERAEQEMLLWIEGDPFLEQWAEQLHTLLDSVQRTSSAAENINSILKPLLTRKKHFATAETAHNFIALFVLWHNMRVFKEGKRAGKSPYEILGIDLGETDWRTLLGYPPL